MLALSKVPDPQRFGVPVFDAFGTLIDVVEKPENPPNDFAVTGIYVYGPKVFFDAFKYITKSPRGEYEISDIHSYFLKQGMRVGYKEITGWWKDTGKPNDLLLANQLLLDMQPESTWVSGKTLQQGVRIEGNVRIGEGAEIGPNTTLVGPVIIGEYAKVSDATVGPYVTLGRETVIQGVHISHSLIFDRASLTGKATIVDSIIGKAAELHLSGENQKKTLIVGDKTIMRDVV
jgi:glucose-1-phosphate thymidylyltransferase